MRAWLYITRLLDRLGYPCPRLMYADVTDQTEPTDPTEPPWLC